MSLPDYGPDLFYISVQVTPQHGASYGIGACSRINPVSLLEALKISLIIRYTALLKYKSFCHSQTIGRFFTFLYRLLLDTRHYMESVFARG